MRRTKKVSIVSSYPSFLPGDSIEPHCSVYMMMSWIILCKFQVISLFIKFYLILSLLHFMIIYYKINNILIFYEINIL